MKLECPECKKFRDEKRFLRKGSVCDKCREEKDNRQLCVECGEPVDENESVKNCHSYCRLEI